MVPLIVTYEGKTPTDKTSDARNVIISKFDSHGHVRNLEQMINDGRIDQVCLVGPQIACGWRMRVNRKVIFVERPTNNHQDAAAQYQASMRIVEKS